MRLYDGCPECSAGRYCCLSGRNLDRDGANQGVRADPLRGGYRDEPPGAGPRDPRGGLKALGFASDPPVVCDKCARVDPTQSSTEAVEKFLL